MPVKTCRVCNASGDTRSFEASERMFGLGGHFNYFLCGQCGCLQAENPGIDASTFYPSNYYSFEAPAPRSGAHRWLLRQRDLAALGRGSVLGRSLLALYPNPPLQSLSLLQLRQSMRIADVGCGAGLLLRQLRTLGFRQLTGIDPHVEADINVDDGLQILKRHLENVDADFDLIMFHHSLEHIADQAGTLRQAYERLAPGGTCLVRIPLVSSDAWLRYGLNWVQLDAPRHLFLHSKKSLVGLAAKSGFDVIRVEYDSNDFQFWGSEALQRGLTLFDPRTGQPNPKTQQIAREGRWRWRKEAASLNAEGKGDQAIFVLRKPAQTLRTSGAR